MTRISDYTAIATAAASDLLVVVDVSDSTMSPAGTTKKMTMSQLPGTGRGATFTVAASNSSAGGKANADYVCAGSGDETTINTAIGALPAHGGRIILLDGLFVRTGSVVIDKSFVILEGQGSAATNLSAAAGGVTGPAVVVGHTAALSGSGVKNMQITDSNGSGTPVSGSTHGIVFASGAGILENVVVQAVAGDEFHIAQDLVQFALSTTIAAGSNGVSLPTATLDVASTTGFASAGSIYVPCSSGVAWCTYTGTSGGNSFTGCTWSFPGTSATLATGGKITQPGQLFDLTGINCYAQKQSSSSGNGFYIDQSYGSCEFFACRASGAGSKPGSTGSMNGWLIYGNQIKLFACHGYFFNGYGLKLNDKNIFTGGALTVMGGEWETNATGGAQFWNPSAIVYMNGSQFYANGIGTGQADIDLPFNTSLVRLVGCAFRKGYVGTPDVAQNIYMQAASLIFIELCEFDYPAVGRFIEVDGAGVGNACTYVFIRGCNFAGQYSGTNAVLLHGGVTLCEVSGNTTDCSIVEATSTETPDANIIRNNTLVPGYSAGITILGPNTRAYDNPGAGGVEQGWSQTTQSSTYTALWGDSVWASGTFTITTPAATAGSRFRVKNTGTGTITVSAASGTIDGAGSWSTSTRYVSAEFECDGTNWSVVT